MLGPIWDLIDLDSNSHLTPLAMGPQAGDLDDLCKFQAPVKEARALQQCGAKEIRGCQPLALPLACGSHGC